MMASLESQVTLVTILIFFDRSYVVPHSCKVSSPGLKWFRINNEGALSASPGLFSVKKISGWLELNKKPTSRRCEIKSHQ